MLRFFFIEYGAQDEIETSYEEGCNRIQKTFDTILRPVDFPFDPGERGEGGKKPFHDARIPFSSLDLGGCLRDATGYICMIPENWTAPRLTGGIYSTVRSRRCTFVEKYMPPSPPLVSYTKARRASRANWIIGDQTRNPIKSLGKGFILHLYRFNAVACPSHMPPPYNSSRWLQNSAFCRQITEDIQIPSQITLNRGDCPSIVTDN